MPLLHISWELENPKIYSSYYLLTRQPQILFTFFQVIACNLRLEASKAPRTFEAHPCFFESNNALMKSFTCIQTSHNPYRQVWICSPSVVKMRALCHPGLPRRLFIMTAGQLNLKGYLSRLLHGIIDSKNSIQFRSKSTVIFFPCSSDLRRMPMIQAEMARCFPHRHFH